MRRRCFPIFLTAALVVVGACGSEVLSNAGSGGAAGNGGVDAECYDACINKGGTPGDCNDFCAAGKGGGKSSSGVGASGTGAGKPSTTGSTGSGSGLDLEFEKSCIDCWYKEAAATGTCSAEAKACEDSLACQQLQWCPLLCEQPDCVTECSDIIPSGVAPLTALVQCVACDDGPCAAACEGSTMLAYCK